jgi:hypothetical protein
MPVILFFPISIITRMPSMSRFGITQAYRPTEGTPLLWRYQYSDSAPDSELIKLAKQILRNRVYGFGLATPYSIPEIVFELTEFSLT